MKKNELEGDAWAEHYLKSQAKKGRVVLFPNDDNWVSMSKDDFLRWLACSRRIFRLRKKDLAEVLSGRKHLCIETSLEEHHLFDEQKEQARK